MSGDLRSANTLFQITEPDAGNELRRRPRGRAIGIDLGTTHSLVAIAPNGEAPRALAHEDGEQGELLASVVAYVEGEPVRVGAAAQAQASAHPQRVLASVKRFMGRGAADIDFAHPYQLAAGGGAARFVLGDQERSPVEASAEILKALRARANRAMSGSGSGSGSGTGSGTGGASEGGADEVQGAVITVPAYFDDAQRQATKDAGRIAGLEVYRLLAEPTAAAVAYGLDRGGQGLFAVYDLGGGTFDISLLRLRDGVFQVLATGGDSALGGDDFDRAVAAELATRAGQELSTLAPALLHAVLRAARSAKEALSASDEVRVALPELGLAEISLSKEELEKLLAPWIRKTVRACRSALKDADLAVDELDGVVLVGGSTRVPAVRAAVEEFFGQPPLTDLDPDKVVAYGAAITADILSGSEREGVTLLDVVPLSLGLETMGGIVEKIIPRNATIPIAARQVFTNYAEKQTGMSIHVVQGERELAEQNRSLAQFELKGMPALPPGMARVEVTFQLDADALLTVTATELMTGVQQRVEVKPTYGLSDSEVDQLVMESLDFAGEDFAARALAEERVELGRVALAVRTAFDEVGTLETLLPPEERPELVAALEAAEGAMAASEGKDADARALKALREHLEHSSAAFARRRMERALLAGMQGQSLAEIESALAEEDDLERRRGAHNAETIESD